ncbi:MAG: flagellar motor protein MotD [Gallionellaceae bacterium]|nr:flagellar motor protein MotD [Gallionellaceae bacterium]
MRKKRVEEHENVERWLVSYADFITLLFAFFVVMYAISSINEGKYRVMSDSLVNAFHEAPSSDKLVHMGAKNAEILQGTGKPIGAAAQQGNSPERQQAAERMKKVAKNVLDAMQPLSQNGKVRVTQSPRGVTVEINASLLFNSGDAVLQAQSKDALAAVAKVLAGVDNAIQVEGHSDNVPINSPAYPSNWELSSARAGSVVRLFAELGVPTTRMVAIGYADNQPLDTNASAEGRARNRRVNVLILNEVGGAAQELSLQGEQQPATPAPVARSPGR